MRTTKMNTAIKATEASVEMATRSRYLRTAVAAVHSWDTTGSVMTLGRPDSTWRGAAPLASPSSNAARNGKTTARPDHSPAYHWSLGTQHSYWGTPIHPLILPTASMYKRPQIADANISAIATVSHANRFLPSERCMALIVIRNQPGKLSSVLVNSWFGTRTCARHRPETVSR
jgi:hypothetical protein